MLSGEDMRDHPLVTAKEDEQQRPVSLERYCFLLERYTTLQVFPEYLVRMARINNLNLTLFY